MPACDCADTLLEQETTEPQVDPETLMIIPHVYIASMPPLRTAQ